MAGGPHATASDAAALSSPRARPLRGGGFPSFGRGIASAHVRQPVVELLEVGVKAIELPPHVLGKGSAVEPASPFARSWSPTGALQRLLERTQVDPALALMAFQRANLALARAVGGAPDRWNDVPGRTRIQVEEALLDALSHVRLLSPSQPGAATHRSA